MTQNPFDPIALWRDMLSKWETGLNELASKNMMPPELMAGLMGPYLAAMNIPNRADLAAIDKRLQRIEDRLADLAVQMESKPPVGVGRSAVRHEAPASTETHTIAAAAKRGRRGARKKAKT